MSQLVVINGMATSETETMHVEGVMDARGALLKRTWKQLPLKIEAYHTKSEAIQFSDY